MAVSKDLWATIAPTGQVPSPTIPNQGIIMPGSRNMGLNPNGVATTGKQKLLSSLQSPDAIAALGYGGLGLLEGILNTRAQGQQQAANRQQQTNEGLSNLALQSGNAYGNQLDDARARDTAYLNSFNQNPVGQQQDIYKAAALRALAGSGGVHVSPGNVTGPDLSGVANQYLNDDSLAGAAGRFYGAAGAVSNTAPPADLHSMGFGNSGAYQSDLNQTVNGARDARSLLAQKQQDSITKAMALLQGGTDPNQVQQQQKKSTPWWKKALKIAAIAGPIAASPFTGGLSLAAIGAGGGAANAALNGGGLTDILLGGGLGAIPMGGTGGGLAKNAARPALGAGLKQAVKSGGRQMLMGALSGGI